LIETCENKPLVFENDMHALAVRWLLTHQAEETEDVLLVYIGDGSLGAAVLIEGRPNRGCLTGGNELGHTRLPIETDVCFCGHQGCLERICSTTYLKNHPQNNSEMKNGTLFERAARCDDNDEPLNDLVKYIGMGLSNAVNFIRPNRLVLVSELTRYPTFSDKLLRTVRSALLFELVNHVRIDVWDQPGAISAESAGWLALAGLFQEGWNPL
jgi:predicted NBD/HSP70 family sugar kinase